MLTQEMIDAAAQVQTTLEAINRGVADLIAQGGGTGGATTDDVLGLLSPLASLAQGILDTINQATGGGPPPVFPATRRPGPGRGPIRR